MTNPPPRRVQAPWADAVFALLARAAALLTLSLLVSVLMNWFNARQGLKGVA